MITENKEKDKNSPGRIETVFRKLKESHSKAFIPFITGGFPDMQRFQELFMTLDRSGSDIIEIGVPFSDPLADGPVIAKTSMMALEQGTNVDILFRSISELRKESRTPIVLMTYFQIIYRYGLEHFLKKAKQAGVDGIIIPDLPIFEFYPYKKIFRNINMDNIMLASLNSTEERLQEITKECRGFVYCVSVKGVTGARDDIDQDIISMLQKLKNMTDLPVCPGFGISQIKHIESLKKYSDGVIIGSKLMSMVLESIDYKEGFKKIEEFVYQVNAVLKSS